MSTRIRNYNDLHDYVLALDAAQCVDDGFLAVTRAVKALGFDALTYTVIPQTLGSLHNFSPVFLSSPEFSPGFLRHYEEAGLIHQDFTIPRAANGTMRSMDWDEEINQGRLSVDQKSVVEIARYDYRIRNAITIPTLSDKHIVAGATVISQAPRPVFDVLKAETHILLRSVLQLFHCFVFSHMYIRREFYQPILQNFSADERRMIEFVVSGMPLKLTSDKFNISPSRAGNILSTLYKQLDVHNASELSYLIGRHQLIEMLER